MKIATIAVILVASLGGAAQAQVTAGDKAAILKADKVKIHADELAVVALNDKFHAHVKARDEKAIETDKVQLKLILDRMRANAKQLSADERLIVVK